MSAAAQQLNVAQSALSLHVRNMEEHLGASLFTRRARGVSLTEAGELLLQQSRILLDELARLEDDIRNLGSSPRGNVRIGMPATIGSVLSVPLVLKTADCMPGVRLRIAEAMSGFVLDWLRKGQIDMAILYSPVDGSEFDSTWLLSEDLVLIAPNSLRCDTPLPPERLADLPLILPGPQHGLRKLLEEWARREGMSLTAGIELDSYTNIKELVEKGHGCSILPLHAVSENVGSRRLKSVPLATSDLYRDVFLIRARTGLSGHACEAVHELIRGLIADLVETGSWTGVHTRARL